MNCEQEPRLNVPQPGTKASEQRQESKCMSAQQPEHPPDLGTTDTSPPDGFWGTAEEWARLPKTTRERIEWHLEYNQWGGDLAPHLDEN
jgi:hypothetical protein